MLAAIELNDQATFKADEVDDIRRKGMLAAELESGQLAVADGTPQLPLDVRRIGAETAWKGGQSSPLTLALSREGRGD